MDTCERCGFKPSESNTEIVIVLDRSGSMSTIKGDMEGALNTLLNDQLKEPGNAFVTMAQFDDQYELVYTHLALGLVPSVVIKPRNMTALMDAIGKTINNVKVPEGYNVIFIIVTDGLENASKEFTRDAIFKMITEKKEEGWVFTFLGANQDAIKEGAKYGIDAGQTMSYAASAIGTRSMSGTLSKAVSNYRVTGEAYEITDEERKEAMEK